jgi:hypothetical protein
MPIFEYEGVNKDGKFHTGTGEAESGEELMIQLMSRGIYPTALRTITEAQLRANKRLERYKKFVNQSDDAENKQEKQHIGAELGWAIFIFIICVFMFVLATCD